MTRQSSTAMGSELVLVLERCWAAIRAREPDLPEAVILTGPVSTAIAGSAGHRRLAASCWLTSDAHPIAEIYISGEALLAGAAAVLATLLHEAAHGIAANRRIQDTSRQGRYHNQRFKAIAEQLGLRVSPHPAHGWSTTTITNHAISIYAEELRGLQKALAAHPRSDHHIPRLRDLRNNLPCGCGCGRRIRVAAGTLAQGAILCSNCHQPFQPVPRPQPPQPSTT